MNYQITRYGYTQFMYTLYLVLLLLTPRFDSAKMNITRGERNENEKGR